MSEQVAKEMTEIFFPLIQKWEGDFQELLLKWIDEAEKQAMPFQLVQPLIRLVVDKRIEHMEEFKG